MVVSPKDLTARSFVYNVKIRKDGGVLKREGLEVDDWIAVLLQEWLRSYRSGVFSTRTGFIVS